MTTQNFYLLLTILSELMEVSNNKLIISHTFGVETENFEIEIISIDQTIKNVSLYVDGTMYNIDFSDIKLMDYDVREFGLLNGFLHELIDKYVL